MNFKSEYFDTVDELVQAKDDARITTSDRRERLTTIRKFVNMMNTMTEEEAEEMGRTEITNHGLTYRDMLQNETQLVSMVTGTNSLLDVIVDTDSPEMDITTGQRISEAINRYVIHYKGKFANFWRKVAGEIVIAGGSPVTMPETYGWLPQLRPDMIFPPETPLDAEEVPYCFDPKELTMSDLKNLRKAVSREKGRMIDVEAVDELIEKIEDQVKNNTRESDTGLVEERAKSIRQKKIERIVTISSWWFYEIKHDENTGNSYVSATLFVDSVSGLIFKDNQGDRSSLAAKVIAYIDKVEDYACDWLHMAVVDSEIGGVKNTDTLRGMAELVYPSALEMEELMNLLIEGDKIRARPKVRITNEANPEDVAKWDIMRDLYAPAGVEEMPFKNDSRGLQTPLALLTQNAANISTSHISNGPQGGELRQQALERQQNSSMLQSNRIAEAYNHLEAILESVVWRVLAGNTKVGTEGYREIMAVRDYLDRYGIDYKKLAERRHGKFVFLRIRAKRTIGNGDRKQQVETADWLMNNIQAYEPAARPLVIHKATTLHTQDPDLADALVKIPKPIINAQKITAENEYDTIRRRAPLGQTLPVAQDDIHQDHIPVHLLDLQAHVATHQHRPWDMLDVLIFAGAVEHVGEHIKILLANPVTNGEAKVFIQDFQNIAQAAQAIVAEVEESQGSEQTQLTPKEQADLELKWAQYQLEATKVGIKVEDMQRLWSNREARSQLSRRQQFTREINEDRRLKLDQQRVEEQAKAKKQTTKPNAKTKSAK